MINIQLEPASIASCPQLPPALAFMKSALQHQVDVFEAAINHDIILDLAPTGTGKTKAGLSVLLHNRDRHAIYIAPTNALIEQQTQAAQKFVQEAGLPHRVFAASAKDVNGWTNKRVGKRSGEKLYNVLREPATIFPECAGKPILLVTNPDIFYYAAFFQYNRLDRSNIASQFYSSFSTVIFDEFHLYDAKQLVSLLFYLALSKVFGYFQHNRKVVLLTATPEPACEAALATLEKSGVKIAYIDGKEHNQNLVPSQTTVNLEIRPLDRDKLITEITNEVIQRLEVDSSRNGAVILDSKNTINEISDQLCNRGFENYRGRITGAVPKEQRPQAAQKQVILATSTVDVGFNFERETKTDRQNLDWLIFSARDRFSFWQRIGRVGRVLGKQQTDIPSEAIAYLSQQAWQELANLDCSSGREALKEKLEGIECMKRPFLELYWRSEAFLEIAKPLLELESALAGLPESKLVLDLFQTLKTVLNGRKNWQDYRQRMNVIYGAENIASLSTKELQQRWKYVKGGQSFGRSFLKAYAPENFEEINTGRKTFESVEAIIQKDRELAADIHQYAKIVKESYAPLFRFRDSLFENVTIYDSHKLLLDEVGETNVNPIHLLRFYEFDFDGDRIIVHSRAEPPYELSFSLSLLKFGLSIEEFENNYLCKLYAFEDCKIKRTISEIPRPTALIKEIEKQLISGVIVQEHRKNSWAIRELEKQGLECYRIKVEDSFASKQYTFFPSLSGILALASAGYALKCPDDEYWVV
ncbi:MAG: type I-D CRISPR-associated helicase Cas3' [Cyanophyceae cyanobacterium]